MCTRSFWPADQWIESLLQLGGWEGMGDNRFMIPKHVLHFVWVLQVSQESYDLMVSYDSLTLVVARVPPPLRAHRPLLALSST